MSQRFESFIAKRYLRGAEGRAEGRRFLRLVTWIAVAGVSVGVATLILALAIVRGFSGEIKDKVIGFAAHVQVQSLRDAPLDNASEIRAVLAQDANVVSISPVIQEFILLRKTSRDIDGVSIWGTDSVPAFIEQSIQEGSASLQPHESGEPVVVIGTSMARLLSVDVGDRVTAFSIQGEPGSGRLGAPRLKSFRVGGTYESSLADFDDIVAFADINVTRSLLQYDDDVVSRFDLRVADGLDYTVAADQLDETLPFPAIARPITDIYRSLFAWVRLQEGIIPLILSIIVLVAAVNIIGTLLMIILEKQQEMGILAGMGASPKQRKSIFIRLGGMIGAAGVVLGASFALVTAGLQKQFGLIPLPAEAYYMDTAPIDLNVMDFILVAAVTWLLCVASSWIPARYAARISPIQAINSR